MPRKRTDIVRVYMISGFDILDRDAYDSSVFIYIVALFHRCYCHFMPYRYAFTHLYNSLCTVFNIADNITADSDIRESNARINIVQMHSFYDFHNSNNSRAIKKKIIQSIREADTIILVSES